MYVKNQFKPCEKLKTHEETLATGGFSCRDIPCDSRQPCNSVLPHTHPNMHILICILNLFMLCKWHQGPFTDLFRATIQELWLEKLPGQRSRGGWQNNVDYKGENKKSCLCHVCCRSANDTAGMKLQSRRDNRSDSKCGTAEYLSHDLNVWTWNYKWFHGECSLLLD